MGAGQGRFLDPNRLSGATLLLRDASDASTACSLDLSVSAAASSAGLPELSEPLAVDDETHSHHDERIGNRSPTSHHYGGVPPPPPPPTLGGTSGSHDLRHYAGDNYPSLHGQTSLLRTSSPNGYLASHSRTDSHDHGYHTLVSRSPWSPTDFADLTLTPSPRAEYLIDRGRLTPLQRTPRKSPRPHPLLLPTNAHVASVNQTDQEPITTEALLAACKGKKWGMPHHQSNSLPKLASFDGLTDDVILRIFSFLPSMQLALCGRVCRRWYVLAWEPHLWSTIILAGDNFSVDRALKNITRVLGRASPPFCPTIERVFLNGCARLSDRGLQTLSRRCPELRHVELRGCAQLTDTGVLELVSKCIHLSHLDASGCPQITCIEAAGTHTSTGDERERYSIEMGPSPRPQFYLQLQYLDLTDCIGLGDAGVQMIVRNCAQLTCFYLRRCINVTDIGIKYLASYCTALRELSISDCLQVTDFGLYELSRLGPNLRYLSVAKCEQISDAGIKQIGRHCYKLRYLNLRGCEAVSDSSLEVLARSCSRLRALDLGKCDITDRGLRFLAEHCPNLKKLSVKSCELVTDEGIRSIAYYCRGLRQLNIQDCLITVEGYRAVKKFCRKCIIEHTNPGFF